MLICCKGLETCILLVQVSAARSRNTKAVPDFSKAFAHVCIHPGARFVIEKIRKTLRFGEQAAAPSHAALHRFGNTSASSTYYILAYTERRVGVKKGDKVSISHLHM